MIWGRIALSPNAIPAIESLSEPIRWCHNVKKRLAAPCSIRLQWHDKGRARPRTGGPAFFYCCILRNSVGVISYFLRNIWVKWRTSL